MALSFESPRLACASTPLCGARTFLDAAHRPKPSDAAIIFAPSATSFFQPGDVARGGARGYAKLVQRAEGRLASSPSSISSSDPR